MQSPKNNGPTGTLNSKAATPFDVGSSSEKWSATPNASSDSAPKQMKEVETLLQERWKEAWWVMYRNGTTPETKFAWISTALSDAQRTAGADTSAGRQEYYTSGGSTDLPSKSLAERFQIADVQSDESIQLQTPPAAPAKPQP